MKMRDRQRTKRSWASFRFDVILAIVLTALVQVQMWTAGGERELGPGGVGAAFALLQTVPLIWRRRRPVIVFLITLMSAAIPPLLGGIGDNGFGVFGALVGFYTVAAYRALRISLPSFFIAGTAASALHQLPQMDEFDLGYLLVPWIPFAFAWFLGVQVRLRRKYAAALGEREAALEQRRHSEAVYAITQERARIARELHDVVGHSLSIIAVQSGAARLNFESRPQQARDVLASIEEAARQATEEMRRLLSVLGGPADSSEEGRGLDDVEALVERVRTTGVDIALRREGQPLELSPGLDISAYRILQEALTNIVKHGGGNRAEVVVRFASSDLELEVVNEAIRASKVGGDLSGGQGLIGMRERVALFSGDFSAAPTSDGGFAVKARIPVETAV